MQTAYVYAMGMPGPFELVIILIMGLMFLAVPVTVVVLAIWISRRNMDKEDGRSRNEIINENYRLRDRLAELEKGPARSSNDQAP